MDEQHESAIPSPELQNSPLEKISTGEIIEELLSRKLTEEQVKRLESLKNKKDSELKESQNNEPLPQPIETTEDGKLVEEIVQSIIKKNVYGKLPRGSMIDGKKVEKIGGFYPNGPDKVGLDEYDDHPFWNFCAAVSHNGEKLPEIISSHIVSFVANGTDNKTVYMTIHFFQDKKQIDTRGGYSPAYVITELPTEKCQKFFEVLRKRNPDLIENFYQQAFKGLDSGDNRPGMRRVKANDAYLLLLKKEDLQGIRNYRDAKTEDITDFLQRKTIHLSYKNGPYGSGDAFLVSQ